MLKVPAGMLLKRLKCTAKVRMSILASHPAKLQIVSRRPDADATAKIIDRATSNAILEYARKRPVRLSDMFMVYWCGRPTPPEELHLWLADRGFEIAPGLDFHAGWEVRPASTNPGFPLFGFSEPAR